jgi:hypothetical protein
MATPMSDESRRLLSAFSGALDRLAPRPVDWQRFYEFILHAFRHSPPPAEAVGHALVQDGLDWEEAERFMLFYTHAIELLQRQAGTTPARSGAGRTARARKGGGSRSR